VQLYRLSAAKPKEACSPYGGSWTGLMAPRNLDFKWHQNLEGGAQFLDEGEPSWK